MESQSSPVAAKLHLLNLTQEAMRGLVVSWGEQPYRARQILDGLYRLRVREVAEMKNLPRPLLEQLSQHTILCQTHLEESLLSPDQTCKLAIRLDDGEIIEAVYLPESPRRTACVSTQVGCPIRCVFCASGIGGLVRHLSAGEMIESILHLEELCPEKRLTNVVLMGIGEPLSNPHLKDFLSILCAPWGLGYSRRRITVSTSGLLPAIKRLGEDWAGVNLAISLHAPDDETRRQLVPTLSFKVKEIVAAAREFAQVTGRAVTFEYVLLNQINDSVCQAHELGQLIKGFPAKVNLIPYNPVAGLPYSPPSSCRVKEFATVLQRLGIAVSTRKQRGVRIDAACGQLRQNRLMGISSRSTRTSPKR